MNPVPDMDGRLYWAVLRSQGHWADSLYDLKKVKVLKEFDRSIDPYYERPWGRLAPGDFSAIGRMENLHTLIFDCRLPPDAEPLSVNDFSFLTRCKKLKKLDLRWTSFTDCALLLQLPNLRQVRLPPREQLTGLEGLEELAGRGVSVELPPAYVPPELRPPAQGSAPARAVVEEIKKRTAADCYTMKLLPGTAPGLYDSKVGGLPYWDPALPYPVDSAGEKLILLAQINLAQLPADGPLPREGMLQFFAGRGDSFGADWGGDTTSGFQVVWHRRLDPSLTAEQLAPLDIPTHADVDYWPVMTSAAVTLEKDTSWMGPADGRFDALFAQVWEEVTGQPPEAEDFRDLLEEPDRDYLYDQLFSCGHRLLGYPCFTQFDPREADSPYDTLLLQLDSDWTDEETYIMWADGGVGNFFISGEDLKNRDFSRVFYTWDCG